MKQYSQSLAYMVRHLKVGESVTITPKKRKRAYDVVWSIKKENPHLQFKYTVKSIIRTA